MTPHICYGIQTQTHTHRQTHTTRMCALIIKYNNQNKKMKKGQRSKFVPQLR